MHDFVEAVSPPSWWIEPAGLIAHAASLGSRQFKSRDGGLAVWVDVLEVKGAEWIHVSVSRRSRVPAYEDLTRAKADFLGDDRVAYQVFPKAAEHRNTNPNCLHLWSPLGADPFPDTWLERANSVGRPDNKHPGLR